MNGFADPDWRRHCAEPAIAAASAARGRDLWAAVGGCPRGWREAAELYRRLGVRTLRDAATAMLGPEIDPKRAMRGDVVMANGALGLCRGETAEFMDAVLPMRKVEAAWRAGA